MPTLPCGKKCTESAGKYWAPDVNWSRDHDRKCLITFIRNVGGPLHMLMRRYRFIEDGLMLGKPETAHVVDQARQHTKLWYRMDDTPLRRSTGEPFEAVMSDKDRLLFDGFADMLNRPDAEKCPNCRQRTFYGTDAMQQFGGVELCDSCRHAWSDYLLTFATRAAEILPLAPSKP